MMIPITVPLVNPNENEVLLAALFVQEGQPVEATTILCSLETTKSTLEMEAGQAGFILGLQFAAGATLKTGEVLCWLSDDPLAQIPQAPAAAQSPTPAGLRITRPAMEWARQQHLDLSDPEIQKRLPSAKLLTEADLRRLLAPAPNANALEQLPEIQSNSLVLYGAGGHAKMLIDLLRDGGQYRIAGLVDDGLAPGQQIMQAPVLGGGNLLPELRRRGITLAVNAVGGIGNIAARMAVSKKLLDAGFSLPALVHPSAFVEPSASLAAGAQVFARAYIGGEARVEVGAIASTGSILSHDCVLEEYAIVSPGAVLAGEVTIGARALIGMGVTINLRVRIGAGARVGNNATVNGDVPPGGVVHAGTIWPA